MKNISLSIITAIFLLQGHAYGSDSGMTIDLFALDRENNVLSGQYEVTYCLSSSGTQRECLSETTEDGLFEEGSYQGHVSFNHLNPEELTDSSFLWITIGDQELTPFEMGSNLSAIASKLSERALQADIADVALTVATSNIGTGLQSTGGVISIDTTAIPRLGTTNQWSHQQLFSNIPTDTDPENASVRINPIALPDSILLAIQNDGLSKMTVDAEGDMNLAGNFNLRGTATFPSLDGLHYVGLKGPNTLSGNQIWTLPESDGSNGQILATDGSGALTWVSAGGTGTIMGVTASSGLTGGGTSGIVTVGIGTNVVTSSMITDATITTTDISNSAGITDAQVSDTLTASIFLGSGSSTNAVDLSTAETSGVLPLTKGGTGVDLSATGGSNQFVKQVTAGGVLTVGTISDADIPNTITISLANTATALAANGSNCSAGQYPLGVDASGSVEGCTTATTGTVTSVGAGTGLSGGPITNTGSLSIDQSFTPTWTGLQIFSNQSVFRKDPSDTTFANASLLINPATSAVNEKFLAISDNGSGVFSVDKEGDVIAHDISASTVTAALSGNATTATALAANGSNCGAGQYPLGIDASGNVESCTAPTLGTVTNIATGTGLSGGPITSTGTLTIDQSFTPTWTGLQTFSNQSVFTRDPTDTTTPSASLLVNPTTSDANEKLFAIEDNGSGVFSVDKEGDVIAHNINASTVTAALSGNATTATALAANGTNCSAGQYPLGVNASGAVEGCTTSGTIMSVTASSPLSSSEGINPNITIQDASTTAKGAASFSASNFAVSSGDVTIKTGGVTTTEIAGGTIADTDISASAAITSTKVSLADGKILVGNGSNQAAAVTMSGDVTTDSAGATTIGTGKVTTGKILDGTITTTDINSAAAIADGQVNDNLTISGGTIDNSTIGATTRSTGAFTSLVVGATGTGATISRILTGSAALDFGSTGLAGGCTDLTIGVANAALSNAVFLGVPNSSVVAASQFTAWVSAAGTVTVRHCSTSILQDPASGTFNVVVFQ